MAENAEAAKAHRQADLQPETLNDASASDASPSDEEEEHAPLQARRKKTGDEPSRQASPDQSIDSVEALGNAAGDGMEDSASPAGSGDELIASQDSGDCSYIVQITCSSMTCGQQQLVLCSVMHCNDDCRVAASA